QILVIYLQMIEREEPKARVKFRWGDDLDHIATSVFAVGLEKLSCAGLLTGSIGSAESLSPLRGRAGLNARLPALPRSCRCTVDEW
ncbi:MAG: hypothetical protein WCY11_04440, partial [Novosphingobium sp.]